ncbi:MAG: diguanylate cyclase, partial [Actinomycetota bacterium]|nr:diguanylate cyclase [Actinomycetota bacterium]
MLYPFLLSAGFVVIAGLLRVWPLSSLGTELLWMTFYPAVLASAVIGGLWVGEFAVGLSLLVAIFLGPLLVGESFVSTNQQRLGLVVFAVTASFICVVSEWMRRTRRKALREESKRRDAQALATSLRQVTEQLELAAHIAHVGSWTLDLATGEVTRSRELHLMQGTSPTDPELDYAESGRLFTAESWLQFTTATSQAQQTGAPYELELEMVRPDGTHGWMLVRGEPVRDAAGAVVELAGVALDISDRIATERALAASAESLRVVLDTSDDLTMRVSGDYRIEYVNRRVTEVTGTSFDKWVGKSFTEMGFAADVSAGLEASIRRVLETGEPVTYEYEADNLEGHRWYETIIAAEMDAAGSVGHLILTCRDTTDRKFAEAELRRRATHDELTGLANRGALLAEINRALSAGRRSGRATGVLMMDLDRFKDVNDTLGHAAGDSLLIAAARRLEGIVRGGDLVARLGGDEFVVVIRDLDEPAEAVMAAERLVKEFQAPFAQGEIELSATASVGVALATESSDAGELLRDADTALYAAKRAGRNRVSVFNADLRAAVSSRVAVENNLRHALARGELAVWYQPEVDLVTGMVIAFEALLRWHHPDGSVWTADRFIEVAEETGMMLEIGDWVLVQACAQAAAWATVRAEPPIAVRVNASTLQLAEDSFLKAVDVALSTS